MTLKDLIKERILYEYNLYEQDRVDLNSMRKSLELSRRIPSGGESAQQAWERRQEVMRQKKLIKARQKQIALERLRQKSIDKGV